MCYFSIAISSSLADLQVMQFVIVLADGIQ